MVANTPRVNKFTPFVRYGQVGNIIPASQWVDNLVLVPGTAKPYTPPTGTDPAGNTTGASSAPLGKTVNATSFRVVATGGPVWVNANGGTAVVPTADVITGGGPICIPPGVVYWLVQPLASQPLSFISDNPVTLSIEAWW